MVKESAPLQRKSHGYACGSKREISTVLYSVKRTKVNKFSIRCSTVITLGARDECTDCNLIYTSVHNISRVDIDVGLQYMIVSNVGPSRAVVGRHSALLDRAADVHNCNVSIFDAGSFNDYFISAPASDSWLLLSAFLPCDCEA